jgi:hypothetical protein
MRKDMKRRMTEFGLLIIFVFTTIALVISASAAPSVDYTWNPSGELYAGQEVTFTAIVTGINESDIISYNWNFGDGSTASGQTVTHQLSKGNNTITLTLKRKPNPDEYDTIAIWANSTEGVLAISASGMNITGSLHTNNDIRITGSDHVVAGQIEYVTSCNAPAEINRTTVSVEDFPVEYDISEYKPGGLRAEEANATGNYTVINSLADIPAGVFDGLYYANISEDITISGNYRSGIFTLVSEGRIHVTGSYDNFTSYIDDLLFFSNSSSCPPADPAFQISKSNSDLLGNIYVPNGQLKISGANNSVLGTLYGDTIQLATSGGGMNYIIPVVKNINCDLLNGTPGLEMNVKSSYIGDDVPVEVKFAVTKNVSAMLAVDGYKIWGKDPILSVENISWIPMSSGIHVITTHLYSLNGMECDNSSFSLPIYIKKVQ